MESVHGAGRTVFVVQSFLSSLDLVKSQLETRVDHQDVVGGLGAIGERDGVVGRVEGGDSFAVPVEAE